MSESFDPYRKWLGIPPEEQPPNHYRLLGVPLYESDPDVIENAVHRQMSYVRTFQTGKHAAESQKLLNELAGAKICLLSRSKKKAYDDSLLAAAARPAKGSPTKESPPQEAPQAVAPATSAPPASVPSSLAPPSPAASSNIHGAAAPLVAAPAPTSAVPAAQPAPFAAPLAVPVAPVAPAPVATPSTVPNVGVPPEIVPTATAAASPSLRFEGEPLAPAAEARPQLKPPKSRDTKSAKHPPVPARNAAHKKKLVIWVPVLSSLGGVAIIVVLVVAYVASKKSDAKPTDRPRPDKGDSSHLASANPMFDDKTGRTKSNAPPSKVGSTSSRPKPDSESRPHDEPKGSDREERIHTQLASIREAFGKRDLSRLGMIATASSRPQRNPRLREELEQTQILGRYLEDFWKAANRGVLKIQKKLTPEPEEPETPEPADEKKPAPKPKDKRAADEHFESPVKVKLYDRVLEVSEIKDGVVKYRVGDQDHSTKLRELPSLDAAAIAAFALKGDDLFGRVYVAAFLCVDDSGDREENLRLARRIATDIEEKNGAPFPYLQRELELAAAGK